MNVFLAFSMSMKTKPYDPDVLARILSRVASLANSTQKPSVIFDLDDTLFDTGSRTRHILAEFARTTRVMEAAPSLAARIHDLEPAKIQYSILGNLDLLGITDTDLRREGERFWWDRFFNYSHIDDPSPGAVAYVNAIHEAGATVIYLSGRDEARMLDATKTSLRDSNMPLDGQTQLILKPDPATDDLAFKQAVFKTMVADANVVAGFENEPRNLNLMHDLLPSAQAVFVHTRHSDHPERPYPWIAWIRDFRL